MMMMMIMRECRDDLRDSCVYFLYVHVCLWLSHCPVLPSTRHVYTMQPVVEPVEQPAASCKRGLSFLPQWCNLYKLARGNIVRDLRCRGSRWVQQNKQELIRRWDSERELLYNDNIHVEASAYAHSIDLLISTKYQSMVGLIYAHNQ